MAETVISEAESKEAVLARWEREQDDLRKKIITVDVEEWQMQKYLQYVGGVDVSFLKNNDEIGCAALVVCRLPDLKIVYHNLIHVNDIKEPYIPGFLGFREVPVIVETLGNLRQDNPEFLPQVVLVDGNGILHPRRCGSASQLGVMCDIPTIGVSKNLYQMDGLTRNAEHQQKINALKKKGEFFPLIDKSGDLLGMAVKSCDKVQKPLYISIGHKINLETAMWTVLQCTKYRVPEPIRQADFLSREYLRTYYPGQPL